MANDLNRCTFIGHLGRDPELKYMSNGRAVANFSIACNEEWKDKESGEKQERAEWVRCAVFGKLAEIAGEYLKKGAQVYAEGKLRTRKYQDKEGQDRYATEVVLDWFKMLGGRGGAGEARAAQQAETYPEASRGTAKPAPAQQRPPAGADFDDDIPF